MTILGDLIEIIKGYQAQAVFNHPEPGTIRYLQINDLRPNSVYQYTSDDDGVIAYPSDVVIAWDGANAGTVGFNLHGYIGSTLAVLRPVSKEIMAPFLGYFLQYKFNYLQKTTTGAAIPHLSRNLLISLNLDVPSKNDQIKIIYRLKKADRIRNLRKYSMRLRDSYLQSVFLDMFGEPEFNSRNWDFEEISNLCEKCHTINPTKLSGFRSFYIDISSVNDSGEIIALKIITKNDAPSRARQVVRKGDVIILTVRPNLKTAAIISKVFDNQVCSTGYCVLRPKNAITSEYLYSLLMTKWFTDRLVKLSRGASYPAVTSGEIFESLIPLPPIEIQKKYSKIFNEQKRLNKKYIESERQSDQLFQGMLKEVFD